MLSKRTRYLSPLSRRTFAAPGSFISPTVRFEFIIRLIPLLLAKSAIHGLMEVNRIHPRQQD
jgi:hypothetical protein